MSYPVRQKLLEIPGIKDESDEVLDWLIENGEYRCSESGSYFFKKGDQVDYMMIILEGEVNFMIEAGGNYLPVGTAKTGDITGILPYSRMKEAGGHSQVVKETHALALHKDLFPKLEQISQSLVQTLVNIMSDRVRNFTMRQQQREKMEALGKMSAGIAHELNNPASAIRSTSRELDKVWEDLQEITYTLMCSGLDFQTISAAKTILNQSDKNKFKSLSIVEKSGLEDELIDLLDDFGFENSLDLAEELINNGIDMDAIESIQESIGSDNIENFLKWYLNSSTIKEMIGEIHDASERISNLVGSIKSHSHMDRAPELGKVNVRKGLESTLVIFQHKMKDKKVKLNLNFQEDLPEVLGMEGELNQVWTNMIDNSLDAMEEDGELGITTEFDGKNVHVKISDNGSGIPSDILDQIFDPFFTTKSLGKGSGLGLDISNRIIKEHHGSIKVSSKPGNTEFDICLPLEV